MNDIENYLESGCSRINYSKKNKFIRLYFFLIGFALSIVFVFVSNSKKYIDSFKISIFDREQVLKLSTLEYDSGILFLKTIRIRMFDFILIYLLSTSRIKKIICLIIIMLAGFFMGLLSALGIYFYGLKGILLVGGLFCPQGFIYFLIFLNLFNNLNPSDTKYYHKIDSIKRPIVKKIVNTITISVFFLFMFLLGTIIEAYINPEIIKKIALLF